MADPVRTAILQAGEEAFKLDAFSRVSVAGVADAANVSVGAIYHHFGDKEGLHAAVVERTMEEFVEVWLRPAFHGGGTPVDRLTELSRRYIRFFERQRDSFRLLAAAQHDARESRHAQRFNRATLRRVSSLVNEAIETTKQGQSAGELRVADPGRQVMLIWSALYGMCSLAQKFPSPVASAAGNSQLEDLAVELMRLAVVVEQP